MVFYLGIGWLAVLLGVIIVHAARSRSTAARILALDLVTLTLIGLLALAAGEDRRSFALDAALETTIVWRDRGGRHEQTTTLTPGWHTVTLGRVAVP